jgi:DNA-binding response OmpR family regulator
MTPKRILVIEDDLDYEGLLASVLAQPDDTVLESVGTLSGAIEGIERSSPDVILVDLDLPDSSGYPTFLRVREAAHSGCVIVLTGLDDERTATQAMEDGAEDYLVKSLTPPGMILQRVQMALRRSSGHAPLTSDRLVLGFLGSKGGVGTSTLVENLAAVLSHGRLGDRDRGFSAVSRSTRGGWRKRVNA